VNQKALWLVVATAILLAACSQFQRQGPPPVYLIAVDTLRADALGVYGSARPTPFLDEFAKQAIVFENCFAPASWTVPSMASLFTGLYPFHHGAVKALEDNGQVLSQQVLSGGWQTLAEMLKERGYRTYGVSASGHLAEQYGFAQGFDEFVTHPFLNKEFLIASWQGMLPRVTAEHRFGQPVFGFFFFFDTHHPYAPTEPYISRYYPGWTEAAERIAIEDVVSLWKTGYFQKDPEKARLARALYDSEVAGLDATLQEFVQDLPGFDDAVVIFAADHGEEFMEHLAMIHGNNLFQPQIHVPLMIRLPRRQGAGLRVVEPVSLIDVFPTLAELSGAANPPKTDGVSLASLWKGGQLAKRDLFLHLDVPWAHTKAMVRWPRKYVWWSDRDRNVFDLTADQAEVNDLAPAEGAALDQAFRDLEKGAKTNVRFPPRTVSGEISDEMREKLKNLGYINN
jgi:arylsulfatase A-like enzyme